MYFKKLITKLQVVITHYKYIKIIVKFRNKNYKHVLQVAYHVCAHFSRK